MPAAGGNSSPSRSWAFVTGASSGIGAAIAEELARRGHDVILIGRNEKRLQEVATRLARDHGARFKVFAQDITHPNSCKEILDHLGAEDINHQPGHRRRAHCNRMLERPPAAFLSLAGRPISALTPHLLASC